MDPETKLALGLIVAFSIGIALVAVGLGVTTKSAAFAVGVLLCLAATRIMAGGRR